MEKYVATIEVANFNTNSHHTARVEFESNGGYLKIGNDLTAACNKVVSSREVWWLVGVEMLSKKHFYDGFSH